MSTRTVHAACPHDCPDTCAMLVTVEDGRAVKVRGDPRHPPTQGVLCTKVSRYLERTYHPERLLYPMRRVGAKGPGQGRLERIGWDEALATIAERLMRVAADDPQAILPYAYSGTLGLVHNFGMPRRFFHRLGASQPERVLCATAGRTAYNSVIGAQIGTDIVHFADARRIVLWGTNPVASNLHLWSRIAEARRRGAQVIAIDPYRSLSAEKADWHLAPRPGTDGALAFGVMHVLVRDGLLDHDYIARHTLGFDALAERAAGFAPERVAATTGLAAADVERLAHDYAAHRATAIRVNFGLQRHAGGGNAVRAIACLPALTGAWRDPAGGVLLDNAGAHAIDLPALDGRHLLPDPARPPRSVNMAQLGRALTELADPPIRALFVYAANPVASAPNNALVRRGLLRDDLFTVVHEIFPTDTCDYADIVLPATTQLEQFDVHRPYGTLYTMLNEPAIAPLGEAVSNAELFRRLARSMGFTEPELAESDEEATPRIAMPSSSIVRVQPLGLPWPTLDPFLFCVHHDDAYPPGNGRFGPAASLDGRRIGNDFAGKDGWRMYHGASVPGFPSHPHRGFETVTIVRRGLVDHADSLGAAARFGGGDVQWLTAGNGINHAEMFPLLDATAPNPLELFQIWLNLPARSKRADPHFTMFWAERIPERVLRDAAGRETRIDCIAGRLDGTEPLPPPPDSWAADANADVAIWTLRMAPGARVTLPPAAGQGTRRMLYFFAGAAVSVDGQAFDGHAAIELQAGAPVALANGPTDGEFLLLQGRPIGEPVVQYGPFVMNTEAELRQAFDDYRRTGFGGWPWPDDAPVHGAEPRRFARHADGQVETL